MRYLLLTVLYLVTASSLPLHHVLCPSSSSSCLTNGTMCILEDNVELACPTMDNYTGCLIQYNGSLILSDNAIISLKGFCSLRIEVTKSFTLKTHASITASLVEIQANSFVMERYSRINTSYQGLVDGPGHGSSEYGASYGGSGGKVCHNDTKESFDYFSTCFWKDQENSTKSKFGSCVGGLNIKQDYDTNPEFTIGSGGGNNTHGGGRVVIITERSISMMKGSSILANGEDANTSGAGSGGAIYMESLALSLQGSVEAKGGFATCNNDICYPAGGGGRVMFSYLSSDIGFENTSDVTGGGIYQHPSSGQLQNCLLGAAGTEYHLMHFPSGDVGGSVIIRNSLDNSTLPNFPSASTPISVAFNDSTVVNRVLLHEGAVVQSKGMNLLATDTMESSLELRRSSYLYGRNDAQDGGAFLINATKIAIGGDSHINAKESLFVNTSSIHIDASSSLQFSEIATIVANDEAVLVGNISGSYQNTSASILTINAGQATCGGNVNVRKLYVMSERSVTLTNNVETSSSEDAVKAWGGCDNAFGKQMQNYTLVLRTNQSVYIGQEGLPTYVNSSSLLLCAHESVIVASGSALSASGAGPGPDQGIGRGLCCSTCDPQIGGGGGFGGRGGSTPGTNNGGLIYSSEGTMPAIGSGGGCSGGGAGAGIIVMQGKSVYINGSVLAEGGEGRYGGGGGSGGFIEVGAKRLLSGNGKISVDGGSSLSEDTISGTLSTDGNSTSNKTAAAYGGGGGGGRLIFRVCETKNFDECTGGYTGTYSANGGETFLVGGNGSVGAIIGVICPLGYGGALCKACLPGTYKDVEGTAECMACSNAPTHAYYTRKGSITSDCEWSCMPGYSGDACLSPVDQFLSRIGGQVGFFIVLITLVLLLTAVGLFCGTRMDRRPSDPHFESQTLGERQALLSSHVKDSSFYSACSRLWAWPHVGYPKLLEQDLDDHYCRIYFSGSNTYYDPWRIQTTPPEELDNVVYETEFREFVTKINRALDWRGQWAAYFISSYIWSIFCYPLKHDYELYYRHLLLNNLKGLISTYNHRCMRGPRARALLNSIKLGYTYDYTLAYLEILYRENDTKQLGENHVGKPHFPMVLLFGGQGTYESPYHLDASDLLVRSIPQDSALTTFIDEEWIEVVAKLNVLLRAVYSGFLSHTLEPVLMFLNEMNTNNRLGGLYLSLGKFWITEADFYRDLSSEKNIPLFKLGLYLCIGNSRKDGIANKDDTKEKNTLFSPEEYPDEYRSRYDWADEALSYGTMMQEGRMIEAHDTKEKSTIREEALYSRESSTSRSAYSPDRLRTFSVLRRELKDDLSLDTTLPLPGVLYYLDEFQKKQHEISLQENFLWFLFRYVCPCNVLSKTSYMWLPAMMLLFLLVLDLVITSAILIDLRCVSEGEILVSCSIYVQTATIGVYPLAILLSPIMGVISVALSSAEFSRKFSMWNSLSMINVVACIVICSIESTNLVAPWFTAPLPLIPFLLLLVKFSESIIIERYIAKLESVRHRRGWRGLVKRRISDNVYFEEEIPSFLSPSMATGQDFMSGFISSGSSAVAPSVTYEESDSERTSPNGSERRSHVKQKNYWN